MKRNSLILAISLALLGLTSLVLAADSKPKPAPLTGTWQCTSHGGPQGDMEFTLELQQNEEEVTGSVNSPIGSADLTSASFKKNKLEIHIDTPDTKYLLTADYKKGQLAGEWSTDAAQKGTWEGKKAASSSTQP
ncbi:MAG TPA: hypothetical protein VG204_05000 [Terriglobia bacterium]|nr:hypothetical protein [Terriglobia bacterium]